MKNKMYVFKTALAACLGSVVAASAVMIAPTVGVNAAALTNGPIYFPGPTGVSAVNSDGTTATVPSFMKGTPSYSVDGELVTWVEMGSSTSGPVFKLMIAKADGTNIKTLAQSPDLNTSFNKPQITSDKQKVIFYNKNNTTTNIVEVSTATENQTPTVVVASSIAVGISDMSLSVNDDIAYISRGCGQATQANGVFIKLANATPATQPLANTCAGETSGNYNVFKDSIAIAWNGVGDKVFVLRRDTQANKNEILVADKTSGITTAAIASMSLFYGAAGVVVSPDGTKIAFVQSIPSQITVMDVAGTNSTVISVTGNNSSQIAWGISTATSGGSGSTPSSGGNGSSSTGSGNTSNNTGGSSGSTSTAVVPGVTVTDTKIYTQAPPEVASSSAVSVLTEDQIKTQRIVSNTPSVCVPTKDDIVFIDEGRCSASILSKKSGKVLRQFRTTVVEDEVTELKVGNEVSIVAPIYFDAESTDVNSRGMRRIRGLASQINAAGEVLVVGHSGIALGDTPENRQLSRDRAISTVKAIKKVGAAGPFTVIGVGSKSPAVTSTKGKDQAKNRRTVIILVP